MTAPAATPAGAVAAKPRNVHIPCLTGWIKFAIPIDVMDQTTLKTANDLVNAAKKVLADGKASAEVTAPKPGSKSASTAAHARAANDTSPTSSVT